MPSPTPNASVSSPQIVTSSTVPSILLNLQVPPAHTPQGLCEPIINTSSTPAAFDASTEDAKFATELSRIELKIVILREQLRSIEAELQIAEEDHRSVTIGRYMFRSAREAGEIECMRMYRVKAEV